MKNAVPFYRSQSAMTASVCVEGLGSSSRLRRPGWSCPAVAKAWMNNRTACADNDHKLTAAGFRMQFFVDSRSILALDRRT